MPLQTMLHESSIRVIDYRCTAAPGDVSFPEVHRLDSLSYVRKGSFGCRVRGESHELIAGSVMVGLQATNSAAPTTTTRAATNACPSS